MSTTAKPPAPEKVVRSSRVIEGTLLGLGAAGSYAVGQVVSKSVVSGVVQPQVATFFALLFGTLIISVFSARHLRADIHAPRSSFLFITLAGLCASSGVMGMFFALKNAPVVIISPIFALNPLVALILTSIFLQRLERVTVRMMAGGLLVVAGAALVAYGASL
ncbi:MAG: DMT family transporter [Chloroflexi bacterium]|nr:DMT family transporter [Chloroflexota bacterium]